MLLSHVAGSKRSTCTIIVDVFHLYGTKNTKDSRRIGLKSLISAYRISCHFLFLDSNTQKIQQMMPQETGSGHRTVLVHHGKCVQQRGGVVWGGHALLGEAQKHLGSRSCLLVGLFQRNVNKCHGQPAAPLAI